MSDTTNVVVAALVNHSPAVLEEFFSGLDHLDDNAGACGFVFADRNEDPLASAQLATFVQRHPSSVLLPATPAYDRAPAWSAAATKDALLACALLQGASHVLLVESNVLLPPPLPAHLVSLGLDIVSEVYWTEWDTGAEPLPQVWLCDQYNLWPVEMAAAASSDKMTAVGNFLAQLHQPGTYEVGGLGGCTLISRAVIERSVSFRPLPNISFWGDDRHFCVRATANGFGLWADTQYPPLHLYREHDLGRTEHFWAKWLPVHKEAA